MASHQGPILGRGRELYTTKLKGGCDVIFLDDRRFGTRVRGGAQIISGAIGNSVTRRAEHCCHDHTVTSTSHLLIDYIASAVMQFQHPRHEESGACKGTEDSRESVG